MVIKRKKNEMVEVLEKVDKKVIEMKHHVFIDMLISVFISFVFLVCIIIVSCFLSSDMRKEVKNNYDSVKNMVENIEAKMSDIENSFVAIVKNINYLDNKRKQDEKRIELLEAKVELLECKKGGK
jgi:peptidoglycan hydrolase CwlO-like protein